MIPAATFEGLFVRGLAPQGAFREALVRAGFDAAHMQVSYPAPVWEACLEMARTHACAGLARAEADFQLGQKFNQGFFDTMVGSLIKIGMPLLGLKRVIARLPRTAPTAFPGVQVELASIDERSARVRFASSPISADFARGVFSDAARLSSTTALITVVSEQRVEGGGFAMELTAVW
jgi:uncharacterized protein (TIGR02265 family)